MSFNEFDRWFRDNGDYTLRVNYPLNEHSIVFDLGGYHGDWTDLITSKYNCNVHVFEPIPDLYNKIKSRFSNNDKVKVYDFGIAERTGELELSVAVSVDSSSFYTEGGDKITCNIVSIVDFIRSNNITNVDLIKINIEGGEYPVLDTIISNNLVNVFDNIQVQFHNMNPDSSLRRDNIRKELSKTHSLTYDYEFVWENWKRN